MANMMVTILAIMSVADTKINAHALAANSSAPEPVDDPFEPIANQTKMSEFESRQIATEEPNGIKTEMFESNANSFSFEINTTQDEPFIGPRDATSDDFMTPENSGPHDMQHSPATGFSTKESSIFENARDMAEAMFSFSKKRKLYEYDPMPDYTCLINR